MILTTSADDAASLAIKLSCWECAEYFFTALVVVACVGEYVASFTDKLTGGDEGRKKTLEKRSTLLLVVSLALELVCLFGTNVVSGRLIGSLDSKSKEAYNSSQLAITGARSAGIQAEDAKTSAKQARSVATDAKDAAEKAKTAASDATTSANGAHREADSVHQELGKASGQLAQVEGEAQKTKSDLINLAICNAPRVIDAWSTSSPTLGTKSYADPLRPMAGQVVFIEFVPDAETRRAAFSIARALIDAKWDVQEPLRAVDGLKDGVSVQPSLSDMKLVFHANDVADMLVNFLHSYNWQAARGWADDEQGKPIHDTKILPGGAIRIQVGLYPPAIYVRPPGERELESQVEKMRLEREKADAEAKRKMSPEMRKQFEEFDAKQKARYAEQEAKMKSLMSTKDSVSSGPCQVLNPVR